MKVNIKKGTMDLAIDRSDLVSVDHSHDGIVFNFKNGTHLYNTDQYMPLDTKQKIKNSCDTFDGNIAVQLDNYQTPVVVELGK